MGEQRTVWIACRAKPGCTGQQASVVTVTKTAGGGSITRFKCLTCGRAFHVQV